MATQAQKTKLLQEAKPPKKEIDNIKDNDSASGTDDEEQVTTKRGSKSSAPKLEPQMRGRYPNFEELKTWFYAAYGSPGWGVSKLNVCHAWLVVYNNLSGIVSVHLGTDNPNNWDLNADGLKGKGGKEKNDGTDIDLAKRFWERVRKSLGRAEKAFMCNPIVNAVMLEKPLDPTKVAKVHAAARELYAIYNEEYMSLMESKDLKAHDKPLREYDEGARTDNRIPSALAKEKSRLIPGQKEKDKPLTAPLKAVKKSGGGKKRKVRDGDGDEGSGLAKKRRGEKD